MIRDYNPSNIMDFPAEFSWAMRCLQNTGKSDMGLWIEFRTFQEAFSIAAGFELLRREKL
jgi:hypothetical protein